MSRIQFSSSWGLATLELQNLHQELEFELRYSKDKEFCYLL